MSKRIPYLIVIALCCISLSGCGFIKRKFEDFKNGVETQAQNLYTGAIEGHACSEDTFNAMSKYKEARAEADKASEGFWGKSFTRWIPLVGANAKQERADNAFASFKATAESDSILKDSLTSKPPAFFDKIAMFFRKIPWIPIIIVIVILIIIACLLKKKPSSKDVKAPPTSAPVANVKPAQTVKSTPAGNPVDSKQAGKIDVSQDAYMRMIKENCAKAGLDPNKLLADCNGNKELAFQRSNVAAISRKG